VTKADAKIEASPLTKKEKKRKTERRTKGDWIWGLGLLVVVVVVALTSVMYGLGPAGEQVRSQQQTTIQLYTLPLGDPTLTTCVSQDKVVMRLKVNLKIIINNTEIRIPARIGVSEECVRPVHTKDASGTIYVESPIFYPYTLKDFFAVWNQMFSKDRLFFFRATGGHTITMTVNGQPSLEYEDHVLSDGEQIVITYN